jgi:hypothetical protein
MTGKQLNDTTYGPYCTIISIHDNKFDRSGLSLTEKVPDLSTDLGKLLTATFKGAIDIFVDGSADPKLRDKNGQLPEGKKICIRNNGDVKFGNLNMWKVSGEKDIMNYKDEDITKFDCAYTGINGNGLNPANVK